MDYQSSLIQHRVALANRLAASEHIRPSDVFAGVEFDQDNRALFDWAKQQKLISNQEIQAAERRAEIVAALGSHPESPVDLVAILGKGTNVQVRFNGSITRTDLATGQRIDLLITDFARECRTVNASLRIGFNRSDIDDAAENWYQEQRRARVRSISAHLEPHSEFDWETVASTCFNCDDTSPAFVAAVLRKFIHQVVCKLHGKPVGHHLMPVLTGPQGIGKTYFLKHLFGPLLELSRSADFRAISDERNIDLWRSYILLIDEMGYADRSDVDVVKNVITADTLDRRPMRTNSSQTVRQCATLIGASNKKLSELIRDETGNRRFVGIEYSPPADRDFISSVDWTAAWRSVKHADADPLDAHRDTLRTIQEEDRFFGPVEGWLRSLASGAFRRAHGGDDGKLRTQDLYTDYLTHRRCVTGDHDPTPRTQDAFAKELARITAHHPDVYPLSKGRDTAGTFWKWSAHEPLALVVGGRA